MCSPINLSIGVTRSVRSTGASGSGGRCGHLCVRHLVVGRQTRAALVLERETHSGRERVVHPLAGQRAHLKVGHLAVNLTPAARLTGRHLLIRFPQHETIEQSTTSDNRAWALRFYKNLYNIIQNSQDYKFQWTEQSYSHFIMLFSLPDYFEFISRSRQSTGLYSWLFFRPGVHISIFFEILTINMYEYETQTDLTLCVCHIEEVAENNDWPALGVSRVDSNFRQ